MRCVLQEINFTPLATHVISYLLAREGYVNLIAVRLVLPATRKIRKPRSDVVVFAAGLVPPSPAIVHGTE